MFRSILVPLDGSPFAERAIPWASHIAKHTGAKLRLTLVHEPPAAPLDKASTQLFTSVELATRKSARSYLRLLQAKLKEGGARLTSAVTLTGKPGPALARYVQEMGIDLVVMTTHGRGGLQRAWLGSVADYMVHNSKTPVLLLRPKETDAGTDRTPGAGQILVPLDGSPIAEEALEPAAALAQALGAEITLIQVVAPVQLAENVAFPFPSAYDEEITALERRQAQDYLDDKIEELQASGIRASGVAVIGWNTAQT
ncbi:MAG TPA: universal stress protein, partial [Gemmatimonadales bacterium]